MTWWNNLEEAQKNALRVASLCSAIAVISGSAMWVVKVVVADPIQRSQLEQTKALSEERSSRQEADGKIIGRLEHLESGAADSLTMLQAQRLARQVRVVAARLDEVQAQTESVLTKVMKGKRQR